MRQDPVARIGGVTALFQQLHPTYYHPLVDNLPRLLALSRPPYTEGPEVQLLCSKKMNPVEAYLLDRLKPDNFRLIHPQPGDVYELDTVLFTSFKTRPDAGYWPKLYRDTFAEKIWPGRLSRRDGRYLISRRNADHRQIDNFDDCVALVSQYGFEVINPADFNPEDEIELFYDAEILLGAHGAGFANAVFSPPSLTIIDLLPVSKFDPTFYFLAKAFGHRFLHWCGSETDMKAPSFVVDTNALGHLLDVATERVAA
jgi:capsular polysaccharide biosynthesis protein